MPALRRLSLALGLAACGVPQELYDARTNELDRCREEAARAQTALGVTRKGLDEASARREEYRERAERLEREKEQLGNGATPQELEELRRARVQSTSRSQLFHTLEERLHELAQTRLCEVTVRRGRMVVSLADQLLFDPASGALSPTGQQALRQVAAALREIPDRDFLVIGHTDNQPVRGRSNWDVSTAHAVALVRFFQGEGVDPRHLAAAGASEFDGRVPNEAPDLRAHNRRVEVWVMPTVNELPSVTPPPVATPEAAAPAPAPPSSPVTTPAPVAAPPGAPGARAAPTPAPRATPKP